MTTVDLRLRVPFSLLIAGSSGGGKSNLACRLLASGDRVCTEKFNAVYWCYAKNTKQPELWVKLQKSIKNIKFIEGFPSKEIENGELSLGPKKPVAIICDDLMDEIGGDPILTRLILKYVHHMNITFIAIQHSLWFKNLKDNATILRNITYLLLMKSPRDSYTLQHLNKLCYPGKSKFLTEAFAKATKLPYTYIFLDWYVKTPDEYRVRNSIFPDDDVYAFVPAENSEISVKHESA